MTPKVMGSKTNQNVGTGLGTNNDKLALYLANQPKMLFFKWETRNIRDRMRFLSLLLLCRRNQR